MQRKSSNAGNTSEELRSAHVRTLELMEQMRRENASLREQTKQAPCTQPVSPHIVLGLSAAATSPVELGYFCAS